MFEYDKSSKWLIQHHGDSILRLAGVDGIETWRPLQAEVVQPRQLPDGLIEARLKGKPKADLFVLELATFRECRARIDQQASAVERENLLAVTQVLAGLRYNDPGLFQILGGRKAMIESPVLQELKAEWTREAALEAARETRRRAIVDVLIARFGAGAEELGAQLETINDEARLKELVIYAAICLDLEAFRQRIPTARG